MRYAIGKASAEDAGLLTTLINDAFGPAEAFLYEGPRITEHEVRERLLRGTFLKACAGGHEPHGVVYAECREDHGYLGLLAVSPAAQGHNLGRILLRAAEQFLSSAGCRSIEIEVVNHRANLVSYYRTMGYAVTAERPFSFDRLRMPSTFLVMQKPLAGS